VEEKVALGRQRAVQVAALGHHGESALGSHRVPHDVDAGDQGAARGRLDPGGEHADGGGLAGAVGSQQAEHLAGADAERDAVNRVERQPGVALDELVDDHQVVAGLVARQRRCWRWNCHHPSEDSARLPRHDMVGEPSQARNRVTTGAPGLPWDG
jgi:hypothetical protein